MVEVKAKLKIKRGAYKVDVKGQLALPFADRQGGEGKVRLVSGEEVALKLPRGEVLRGGDLVTASDGRVLEVIALPEKLLHIEGQRLAHIAWLLGNGHVPLQFGESYLRMAEAPGMEEALTQFGLRVTKLEAPFEPEVMAGAHDHQHAHDHDHPHGHGHDHGHDHHH